MILVNDEPYAPACPSDKTVRAVAQAVCTSGRPEQRRLVVALYCDGQAVSDELLDAVLDRPASDFGRIEFQTQPVGAMVRATLEQAVETIHEADALRIAAADLLDAGDQPAAMKKLQTFFDLWRQVQQSLAVSAEALGIPLDEIGSGPRRLPDLLAAMKDRLTGLRQAITGQDPVTTGDLLRYDLADLLASWRGVLHDLLESICLDL